MENNTHFPASSQGSCLVCRCGRRCHRHGHYLRKAVQGENTPIPVFRHYCPKCPASYSPLPKELLPICRFPLERIATIWNFRQRGMTPYRIAKALGLGLSCILRLLNRLNSWKGTLLAWCRERVLPKDMPEGLILLDESLGHRGFCLRFSRAFYPRRFATGGSHTI